MDVKLGYKQSEVGIVPNDWDVVQLDDLSEVVRGSSPRPAGDPRYFNGNFVPWLTVASLTNISPNQLFVTDTAERLTELGSMCSRRIPQGTLVIVNSGARTLGVSKILSITCCANDGIAALLPQRRGNREFLCHYLNSQIRRLRGVVAAGNDQLNLNTTRIGTIAVPYPSLVEQEAIATALGDADALIELLEQLVAKKRQIKLGAMQNLLTGQKRLPGFRDTWKVKRLESLGTFFSGGTPSTSITEYYYGDVPWITSSDCNLGRIDAVQGRISNAGVANSATKWIKPDTLLIALYGATAGVVAISEIHATINQAVLAFEVHRENAEFMFQKLRMMKEWIISTYTQGGQPNLSGAIVKSIELPLPEPEEQSAIAAILSDLDNEIVQLEAKLIKTRQVKQGMMQELLTGRIRLV